MSDDVDKAREKLEKEYASVQESLGEVHVAFDAVRNAGAEDDISGLLEDLEKKVKDARTGGVVGSGANSHKRALEKYKKAIEEAAGPGM